MSLATIITSVVTGGSNSHATVSEEANAFYTDFVSQGVIGTITNTGGIAPCTGSFGASQDGTPDMGLLINSGVAVITATPTSQDSQVLRARASANTTAYTINSNSSGSTVYDWIYLKVSATAAANPDSAADDVTALFTSRSTSNTVDTGSPPTFGIPLAIVTVANGASSITNANIADTRVQASLSAPAALAQYQSDNFFDHISSGLVWTGDSLGGTLNASMTAGVVYIGGNRVTVSSISAHAFTASKDTYVYVNNAGTVTFNPQTNNAASPSLPSNSILVGIIVSGASNIADAGHINQGQETSVVPIASSIAYSVTDSLGNLINPRDPNRKLLGYRQITGTFTGAGNTNPQQITGLSCIVIIPTGRKIKITTKATDIGTNTGGATVNMSIWDGVVNSGTQIDRNRITTSGAGVLMPNPPVIAITTPTSTSKTYNSGLATDNGSDTAFVEAGATFPAFIKVELE